MTVEDAPTTTLDAPRFLRRALIVALFIAATGPFIGAMSLLTLVLIRIVVGMNWAEITLPAIADFSQIVALVTVFAYVFAGWSAVLAGLALGIKTYLHGNFGYGYALAVAVLATIIGTASLNFMLDNPNQSFLGLTMFLTPIALVAAAVSRWLLVRFRILPGICGGPLTQR